MDTTINDIAQFAVSYVRGDKLSATARAEMVRLQLAINTVTQFPSLQTSQAIQPFPSLSAALGVVTFTGSQGAGFYKGGHNDSTGNTWVCVEAGKRCVIILANDVRMEAAFPQIVKGILGETGAPWKWEYGVMGVWER